ncbi:13770_t:CDS:2, partial [Racocetra persica]
QESNKDTNTQQSEVQKMFQNFKDIFPKNLLDHLPPKQTVDYTINFVSSSEPSSCPIYRTFYEELLANQNFLEYEYLKDQYFLPIFKILKEEFINNSKQQARVKHFELNDRKIYLKEGFRLAIPLNKKLRIYLLQEHYDIKTA